MIYMTKKCYSGSLCFGLRSTKKMIEEIHLCEMGRRLELCRYIGFALDNAGGQARIKILAEHFIWATIVWRLSFSDAALLC